VPGEETGGETTEIDVAVEERIVAEAPVGLPPLAVHGLDEQNSTINGKLDVL
jgi:hypothetical protein